MAASAFPQSAPGPKALDPSSFGGRAFQPLQLSQGRRPDASSEAPLFTRKPYVIGIAGGTASGKTTVCKQMMERLAVPWVVVITTDSFYRPLEPHEMELAAQGKYNFDAPGSFDFDLMVECVRDIRERKRVEIPVYDFKTHTRLEDASEAIFGADVLVIEGILALAHEPLRDLMDLKLFVDTDADLRLARRIKRDLIERGRHIDNILEQYERTVKPSFDEFCLPTKHFADLIIPHAKFNPEAVDLITMKIRSQLDLLRSGKASNGLTALSLASQPRRAGLKKKARASGGPSA